MIKTLSQTPNSDGLALSQDMREYLGIGEDMRVDVRYETGQIVLSAPPRKLSFDESVARTLRDFGGALKRLDD